MQQKSVQNAKIEDIEAFRCDNIACAATEQNELGKQLRHVKRSPNDRKNQSHFFSGEHSNNRPQRRSWNSEDIVQRNRADGRDAVVGFKNHLRLSLPDRSSDGCDSERVEPTNDRVASQNENRPAIERGGKLGPDNTTLL
jgi:hypothetical protein